MEGFLLVDGVTLIACHCPVASQDALQCLTKFLQKPLAGREKHFSARVCSSFKAEMSSSDKIAIAAASTLRQLSFTNSWQLPVFRTTEPPPELSPFSPQRRPIGASILRTAVSDQNEALQDGSVRILCLKSQAIHLPRVLLSFVMAAYLTETTFMNSKRNPQSGCMHF